MSCLQQILAEQALMEIGRQESVKIRHSEDVKTWIGEKEYRLVFPHSLLATDCSNKDIEILFIGLVTPQRKKFLSLFKGRATIIESQNGRNDIIKGKDENYFSLMSRAKFVLCPDGDFTWTYRFFEAVIFQAIPIIQNESSLYQGYHFFRQGNRISYNKKWIEENLLKIKKEMFLPGIGI